VPEKEILSLKDTKAEMIFGDFSMKRLEIGRAMPLCAAMHKSVALLNLYQSKNHFAIIINDCRIRIF
jgi:hypothetical protein